MVTINSYDEFAQLLGKNIGVSDYVELNQERINLFADATLDHQWIHVDTEKAKAEVNNLKMMINYGIDKMKFGQPVLSGQKIRLVADLHNIQNLRGVCKAEIKFALESDGQKKNALEGIAIFLYYFSN